MAAVFDARFAGGSIAVDVEELPHEHDTSVVVVTAPGQTLELLPHEAVALSVALIQAAGLIERPFSS